MFLGWWYFSEEKKKATYKQIIEVEAFLESSWDHEIHYPIPFNRHQRDPLSIGIKEIHWDPVYHIYHYFQVIPLAWTLDDNFPW